MSRGYHLVFFGFYLVFIFGLFTIEGDALSFHRCAFFNEAIERTKEIQCSLYSFTKVDFINYLEKIKGFLGVIFTLYSIFIGILIFLENKNPSKTIAWLLVLFLVPVIGFFLYLFLGQNVRKKNIFKKKKNRDLAYFENLAYLQRETIIENDIFKNEKSFVKKRLISLILNNAKAPITVNNRSTVLTNGEETFDSIIEELKKAKHHIHVEYFIIKDDEIGGVIKNILIDQAKKGVAVRVIYDGVGSWRLSKKYLKEMREAGVEIHGFLPVCVPLLSRELNYRNHRKIIVIDGKVGFIGGINIGDEYLGKNPQLGFWRDTHLKIEGESVYHLQKIFLMDWLFVTKKEIPFTRDYFPKLGYYGAQLVQIMASGPDSDWESIMQAYFVIISSAEEKIWIYTPYLVPGESVMTALKTAALSGVDVRIIIPSKPDHKMVFWASMGNLEELLRAGVKIYRYQRGFIHAKILLVDGIAASIGTANMDIRSFQINFEANAFIYDHHIVERMEKDFLMDIEDGEEVCLEEYLKRPFVNKFKEAAGRLLSPLL